MILAFAAIMATPKEKVKKGKDSKLHKRPDASEIIKNDLNKENIENVSQEKNIVDEKCMKKREQLPQPALIEPVLPKLIIEL